MKNLIKNFIRNVFTGLSISIGLVGGVFFLAKASGLTAITGEPLTANKWTEMATNFFWGSGTGGIYYNGKVGIGTSTPNKNLHIKTPAGTNAELDLQSGDLPHWGIYQEESSQDLKIRNGVNKVSITNGGVLNAIGGLCINGDCKSSWNQVGANLSLNYTGTCDSAHKGYSGVISDIYKICSGTKWVSIVGTLMNGLTMENAGSSCLQIKTDFSSSASGYYYIKISGNIQRVYCDMTTDGGGWTLVARTVATSNYNVSSSMGTLTTYDQISSSWKLSDSDITNISKTNYKYVCGSTSVNFPNTCVFDSVNISNGTCNTYSNHGNTWYGVTNYNNGSTGVIYYYSSAQGCRGNGSWGLNGRLRVK